MINETDHLLDRLRQLNRIGKSLSAEKDIDKLILHIVESAKTFTRADAGTLYLRDEESERLRFKIMLNDSLPAECLPDIHEMRALPLMGDQDQPNHRHVAAYVANTRKTVNIDDAYSADDFDFSGTRDFDQDSGYRSQSFLTVPMLNHHDDVIGVLQLINAKNDQGDIITFSHAAEELVESLASQAATALSKQRLIEDQRLLFESFIKLIAEAIDEKSPHTGGHCRRVPQLTLMLADAAVGEKIGLAKRFTMSDEDRYELKIAGWLHDCGKVTTPDHVVEKSTKLEKPIDRIELVKTRFAALAAQIRLTAGQNSQVELDQLKDDLDFILQANQGAEYMPEQAQQRVHQIAQRTWLDFDGQLQPLLSDDEVENLTVSRGTLTDEEREIINHHIVATVRMLEALPYPKHLKRVPEFAGGHHERMDGNGYPKGLKREQMSVQARVMGIADVFEALTARDRPYKKGMKLSQSLGILAKMCANGHVDPDLFAVFVKKKVYLDYANLFLKKYQIDAVDENEVLSIAVPNH